MLERIISLVAPHYCIGCNSEGTLLCTDCADSLTSAVSRCYRCHKLARNFKTCQTCRHHSALYAVYASTAYEGTAKDLVWRLKFGNSQAASINMALQAANLIEGFKDKTYIVHVPTATSRIRQRGYDQSKLLSREISRLTSLPRLSALAKTDQTKQVGVSKRQRAAQLTSSFRVRHEKLLQNANIILVDDVITTGATLEACARELKQAGAKRIEALVFAQA